MVSQESKSVRKACCITSCSVSAVRLGLIRGWKHVAVITSSIEKLFREEFVPHCDKLPKSGVAWQGYRNQAVDSAAAFTPTV